MLKVLFAGTPDVAVPSLKMLAEDTERFEVVAVLTRPDAPTGRGRKLVPNPVKQAALDLGLPVIESEPSEETFISERGATGAQAAAVVAYGKILKEDARRAADGMVQPALLAASAVAWRGSRAAFHLGGREGDRSHGVPHRASHGCRSDSGAVHCGNRSA